MYDRTFLMEHKCKLDATIFGDNLEDHRSALAKAPQIAADYLTCYRYLALHDNQRQLYVYLFTSLPSFLIRSAKDILNRKLLDTTTTPAPP